MIAYTAADWPSSGAGAPVAVRVIVIVAGASNAPAGTSSRTPSGPTSEPPAASITALAAGGTSAAGSSLPPPQPVKASSKQITSAAKPMSPCR